MEINKEGVAELKKKLEGMRQCAMTTIGTDGKLNSRPMGTAKVEDDGTLWFFTAKDSEKTKEIKDDSEVMLNYMEPKDSDYVMVEGTATVVYDEERKKEYFNPFEKAWFKNGPEDPNVVLIKVTPRSAEYWESSSFRIVNLFKMLTSAVTGSQPDMGNHGEIKL